MTDLQQSFWIQTDEPTLTYVRLKRTIVRIMRTGRKRPIDQLFPEVRQQVLALLLMMPQQRWYLRDIARQTGLALGTVRRELVGLESAGIVTQVRDGNRTYYQANPKCSLLPELTGLMRKTVGLADVLRDALSSLADQLDLAFVYGSQASGKAQASSDIDLFVVSDADNMRVHRAAGKAEEQLGVPVNYTLLTRREFATRQKEKAGFLARVLAGPKILIAGRLDEVR